MLANIWRAANNFAQNKLVLGECFLSLANGYWGRELEISETKDCKLRAESILDQYLSFIINIPIRIIK